MRGVCQGVQARSRRGRGIRWMMLVENGIGGSLCSTVRIDDQRWSRRSIQGRKPNDGVYGSLYECKTKEGRQYLAFRYHRASAPNAAYRIPSSQKYFSWLFREVQSFLALVMS